MEEALADRLLKEIHAGVEALPHQDIFRDRLLGALIDALILIEQQAEAMQLVKKITRDEKRIDAAIRICTSFRPNAPAQTGG